MIEHFVLTGDLAETAVLGWPDDSEDEAGSEAFLAEYELMGSSFPGDPQEDYYQGMSFTTVYRRKADDKLFGYTYWQGGGKYGEPYYEPNGEDFGYEEDYSTYVFTEVVPFTLQGYYMKKAND